MIYLYTPHTNFNFKNLLTLLTEIPPHEFLILNPATGVDRKEHMKSLWNKFINLFRKKTIPTYSDHIDDIIISTIKIDKRVAIIIGHTESAQGANSYKLPTVGKRLSEYVLNTKVAHGIKHHLQQLTSNCAVKIIRRDGIGIKGAYKEAKKWGATLIVELHFNSMGHDKDYFGAEILTYTGDKDSEELAEKFLEEFCREFHIKNRGVKVKTKKERGGTSVYYGSKYAKHSLLLEPCFIATRNSESARLLEGSGLDDYSRFIATFILEN